MARTALSRPMARAYDDGLVTTETSVFDYGCGRGGDIRRLVRLGIDADGFDPHHRPATQPHTADVVNLGFVVNVIENPQVRDDTLRKAWALARQVLVVAARLTDEARDLEATSSGDGVRTSTGTFQRFYRQDELRGWIEDTLGCSAVAAAPGTFYVFAQAEHEQRFLARRVRRTIRRTQLSRARFNAHEALLRRLMDFYSERGRLPRIDETADAVELTQEFGSARAAFAVVRRLTGDEQWDRVRVGRSEDLLVYLALARFRRRQRPSELPDDLRYDIRDLFGSHKAACAQADRLLFAISEAERIQAACAAAPAGKRLPAALYVHVDAIDRLAPVLRVIEGAAQALIGRVEEATLVKIHTDRPAVSYLHYPDFDTDPHPALHGGYIVKLDTLRANYRDYARHANPPILHRKELFLHPDDPRHRRFQQLTRQEQRAGLYADPSRIGTRRAWEALLASRGLRTAGHRLMRVKASA